MRRNPREQTASLVAVRRAVSLVFGAGMFWAAAAGINLVALCFLPFSNHQPVRRTARRSLRRLFRLWMRFVAVVVGARFELDGMRGLESLAGTVVVANHPTLMDAFYLLGLVPDAVCIFKKSLQRNLLFGPMARLCGFLANEAGPDLVREAGAALAEGCNLVIFPEGTRSRGGLQPFKPGFALIATRYRRPIQSVHLSCVPPLLPGRIGMRGVPGTTPVVSISLGREFLPPPGARAHTLCAAIEAYYRALSRGNPTDKCAPAI